jgi:predicted DNA-binding protein with PD1-like motif
MLLFPVPRAGTYTVHVGAELADSNGRRLGGELKGPVRVQ